MKNILSEIVDYCKNHILLTLLILASIVIFVIVIVWNIKFYTRQSHAKNRCAMSFGRKLLEVLIQIALLPISAVTTAFLGFVLSLFFIPFAYFGYMIEEAMLDWLKSYSPQEGTKYYVKPSDTVSVTETFGGDYKVEVKHDDGERYQMSGSEFGVWVLALFALPLRVITLTLSILALIIPSLKIKAKNVRGTFWSIVFDIA